MRSAVMPKVNLARSPFNRRTQNQSNQKTKTPPSMGRPPQGKSHRRPKPSSPIRKEVRRRNKAHLAFVAAQPCLVCQRSPCDAHHLKFAQPRSLGRKVSDEFTVPLCREHHRDLHRFGNEVAWWTNLQIEPIEVARDLWAVSQSCSNSSIPGTEPSDSRIHLPDGTS